MKEPLVIELNLAGSFDGFTPIVLTRDDFLESGGRYYRRDLTGAAGVIAADLFGLFLPEAVKLVGVAGVSHNAKSTIKVVSSSGGGRVRQQVDLTPTVQYVVMYAGDKLVLSTAESTSTVQVILVANEMSESDHVRVAARSLQATRRRFRLTRATAFSSDSTTWEPGFTFSSSTGLMQSSSATLSGSIPCSSLSLRGLQESIYVRVRFAGIAAGTGVLTLVEGNAGASRDFQSGLNSVQWSKTFVLGYDDKLGLTADPDEDVTLIAADIDVVHVLPGEHLSGRWRNDL